jgi:hypothetical protein
MMGKGKSGHKENNAAKKNRNRYKVEGRLEKNKIKKAKKEAKKNARLALKGKGVLRGAI